MASVANLKAQHQQSQGGASAPPPAKKERTIIDFLSGDPKIQKAIAAVAGQYFTPDRFLRLAVNAIKKTPLLIQCDANTVLGAFMTSAALGLEPNTVLQQAFLIPYKKRVKQGRDWVETYECNFQVGARGFVTLAHRSPLIATLEAEAIHRGDHFKHMKGSRSFLEYEKALAERGDMIGAFCFTKMADGNEHATVLPLEEVYKIRARSETYSSLLAKVLGASDDAERQKAQKKLDETPWVMWEDDMAAKSAIKKHAKQLPLSPGDAMQVAAQLDSDDGRTIDMADMTDPDRVRNVMKEGVDAADNGGIGEAFGATARALEDDPSPTLTQMAARSAEAETVEVHQATEQDQGASLHHLPERTPVQLLQHRMGSATDVDALDAEADLIATVTDDPGELADLRKVYRARRAVLTEVQPGLDLPPAPAAAPAPRRDRRSMMSVD